MSRRAPRRWGRACWRGCLGTLLLLPWTATAQGAAPMPQRVLINYQHMGWDWINEDFELQRRADGSGYTLHARYESRDHVARDLHLPVDLASVRALVVAMRAPAWTRTQGIRAVAAHYTRRQLMPRTHWRATSGACSADVQRALGGQYVKIRGTVAVVDDFYGRAGEMRWTDDYPFAVVQLVWPDGRVQMLHSRSLKAMLLPWNGGAPAAEADGTRDNWSVPVSRQLRALVPADSYLHARLDGVTSMADRIRGDVAYAVGLQCDAAAEGRQRPR